MGGDAVENLVLHRGPPLGTKWNHTAQISLENVQGGGEHGSGCLVGSTGWGFGAGGSSPNFVPADVLSQPFSETSRSPLIHSLGRFLDQGVSAMVPHSQGLAPHLDLWQAAKTELVGTTHCTVTHWTCWWACGGPPLLWRWDAGTIRSWSWKEAWALLGEQTQRLVTVMSSNLQQVTEPWRSPRLRGASPPLRDAGCCCLITLVVSNSVRPHRWQPTRLRSLGFSRQEYWSGLPFPSPVHESEKWKWSRSVVSNASRPHGL